MQISVSVKCWFFFLLQYLVVYFVNWTFTDFFISQFSTSLVIGLSPCHAAHRDQSTSSTGTERETDTSKGPAKYNVQSITSKNLHAKSHIEKAPVSKTIFHFHPLFHVTRPISLSCSHPLLSLKTLFYPVSFALSSYRSHMRRGGMKNIKMAQETEEMSERESRINLSPVCVSMTRQSPAFHA